MRLNPISDEIQPMITLSGSFGMHSFIRKFPTKLIYLGYKPPISSIIKQYEL